MQRVTLEEAECKPSDVAVMSQPTPPDLETAS